MDQVYDYRSRLDELKSEGGFAVSHVGVIRKAGGRSISVEEADDLLEALHTFFSFARGIWCTPLFPRGMRQGEVIWEKYSAWKVSPWKDVGSWFPVRQVAGGAEAWSGFLDAWHDSTLQYPLKIATHWYIEANMGSGAIEGAIVLTQTALELLSWAVIVEGRGRIGGNVFDKLSAAQKIEHLLTELEIPASIPGKLTALQSKAQEMGVSAGHDILVSLRNGIIHPKKSKRDAVVRTEARARWEALQFGLWCVEMSILKLSSYNGVYSNRLTHEWVGEVERIPST